MDYKSEATAVRQRTFVDAVEEAAGNVNGLVERLETLAARLCGAVPSDPSGAGMRAGPDGAFDRVTSQAHGISSMTSRGHEIINRIMEQV